VIAPRVITHGGEDRRYKPCRCYVCGRVAVCRPSFDFYTKPDEPNGLLYCEACMRSKDKNPAMRGRPDA
jgi:hypothetical protein